ncbi:amino acid ABC transporter ATP-binding/permease protein [Halopseudomonas bauzanensis]|uniref:ATP-binding cassette, subfamily C, CydC n=1 Tax=Halopseudomonas bauzanensis TaxID=653930 RepID=A0A1I4KMD8_9GAMM|nr:ATP-binding cassette domain-containing protein [Halopseudomonas bauzanensis]SER37111.1 ATP-binding cassette, subfamily C, CydC [Halopseudomonas bauzanensis]SFL79945.1 ATP-binding cassette, subfamily C, CydC [Halopseudomonas bauzanensis]
MAEQHQPAVRLRSLLNSRLGGWWVAGVLGFITLFSAIALLAVSGWFISAAALAGLALASASVGHGFDIFRPAAVIRLLALTRTVGRYTERLASHHAALGLLRDLRSRLFRRITQARRLPLRTPGAMHRLVADIDLLDQFPLRVVLPWAWASLLLGLLLLWLALLSPGLLLVTLPGLLLAWLSPWLGYWQGGRLAREEVAHAEQRREFLLDSLELLTPLLIWQRWGERSAAFAGQDRAHLQRQDRQQRLSSRIALLQQWALAASLLALLWQGWPLISEAAVSVPLLLAVLLTLLGLSEALLPLAGSFVALGLSQAARDRLNSLAGEAPQQEPSRPRPEGPWRLQLHAVTARWPGALNGPDNIHLQLEQGETLLLQGPSGGGKSTLLQLLAGEQLPSSGECRLNGQPLLHWDVRQVIGYLPQDIDIFNLSLAANLRLGNPQASDEQLWQTLTDVALADWARAHPQQLQLQPGELGSAVSGGQARRIALARLLLAERPVLLLDEPFAGLDATTREQVMAALVRRQAQGLLVIASHQPIMADRLRVLPVGDG